MNHRSLPNRATAILSLLFLLLGCNGESAPTGDAGDTTPADDATDLAEEVDQPVSDLVEETIGDAIEDPVVDPAEDPAGEGDLAGDAAQDPVIDPPVDTPVDLAFDPLHDPAIDLGADRDADVGPSVCVVGFECDPGEVCTAGYCAAFVAECDDEGDCDGEQECLLGMCVEPGYSPYENRVVINEVLIDGNTDEDANGDGTVDALEDAFVELVNISSGSVDISGWTLVERHFSTGLPRHTFDGGTQLVPGQAVVVFGGGDPPDSTTMVLFLAANAADQGDPYGLDLDIIGGDRLRLLDENGRIVAEFAYGGVGELPVVTDESSTRSPDLVGSFVAHTEAPGAGGAIFSPGSRVDGSPFVGE
ncbi:MAG: lamin tail domain-containing protein [Bradymonadales bacterium]|nr:lamin tail domain-containing protein [Bradymonadales bacterium]